MPVNLCGKPVASPFHGGTAPCGLPARHEGLCQPPEVVGTARLVRPDGLVEVAVGRPEETEEPPPHPAIASPPLGFIGAMAHAGDHPIDRVEVVRTHAWPITGAVDPAHIVVRRASELRTASGEVVTARTPLGSAVWLREPEVEFTEAEARRLAAACLAESAEAEAALDRARKATLSATGHRRKALALFAEAASCRARRTRAWADYYDRAADLLEDEADGVPTEVAP